MASPFTDSDSDDDLEVIGEPPSTGAAPLSRQGPSLIQYGRSQRTAYPNVLPSTQQKAAAEAKGEDAQLDQRENDDDSDEDEEDFEVPRSSGTVREQTEMPPAAQEQRHQHQSEDDEDDIGRIKSGSIFDAPSQADISLSPSFRAYQMPSSRQPPPILKLSNADEHETQPPSDAAESEPASESPPDIFGAFFNDTQSFDPQQHGQDASIDIFGNPVSSLAPKRLEDDGDETRVEGDYGFDRLRQDQEQALNGVAPSFDALPSLPAPSSVEDAGSGEEDVLRAMEKQQLILQVERQRANAQADRQPRLMHLNREGLFTQTEPSQIYDDTQSQMFTQTQISVQDGENDDTSDSGSRPRPSSPPRPVVADVPDIFSEDSEDDELDVGGKTSPTAPSAPVSQRASSPPLSRTRKRKLEQIQSSSSPLTSLPPSTDDADADANAEAEADRAPVKRKRQVVHDSDEDEATERSSPSPSKSFPRRRPILRFDDDEDDVEEDDDDSRSAQLALPSPRARGVTEQNSADGSGAEEEDGQDEGEDADVEMEEEAADSDRAGSDDEGGFKLPKVAELMERPYDPDDTDFSEDEGAARSRPAKKGKGKEKEKEVRGKAMSMEKAKGKGKLVQSGLSKFLGVASPPRPAPAELANDATDKQARKKSSNFIAGEAVESEDEDRMPGKRSNKGGLAGVFSDEDDGDDDEDEEDGEEDGKFIEELVDDEQEEDQEQKDKLVAEKYYMDQEEQDKADQELHMRATKGQLRKAKPGMGLDNELDDDAQDDIDRRRIAQGPQKRKVSGEKDGLDDIDNTSFAQVYKNDIRNDAADEADFLAPLESESDGDLAVDSDSDDGRNTGSNEIVSTASVLAQIRDFKRKQRIINDDADESEDEEKRADSLANRRGKFGGSDDEGDSALSSRGINFNNRMQNFAGRPGALHNRAANQNSRSTTSGGRQLSLREEDDDEHAMDLVIKPRELKPAQEQSMQRVAQEFGAKDTTRSRFMNANGGGGGGGGKQNTSSVTQFGRTRSGLTERAKGSGGGGAGAAVMRTGFNVPGARRATGGSTGTGAGGGSGVAGRTPKLNSVFDRSLKFGDSK